MFLVFIIKEDLSLLRPSDAIFSHLNKDVDNSDESKESFLQQAKLLILLNVGAIVLLPEIMAMRVQMT